MTTLTQITLENEMDLILAYKKSMRTAELLGLTLSTQTAFSTAVSEVCREVIDKAEGGMATLGATADEGRFFFTAVISCRTGEYFNRSSEGIEYARKLVPILEIAATEEKLNITLKLSIPRSTRIDQRRISVVKAEIEQEGPISAYEEVKMRNSELQRINQQKELALLSANYLNEQKTEFLSIAAHELNTPLTVLRSYAELAMRMDNGQSDKLTQMLTKIFRQSGKVVALVKQLLDISKLETGIIEYDKEPTNWKVFQEQIMEDLQLAVPNHNLVSSAPVDAAIFADRIRIEQVLNNVVGNAAKYSARQADIQVSSMVEDNDLVISVTDKGIGMSAQTVKNIFQKFYRSDDTIKKYSGLGMGLYVASRIVTDHGGNITVTSVEGEGSTFNIHLPLLN
ncbi:HAMP domain-containing histidine kinase [Mucilaginibacter limnophilus]|uniref:histidine kinase n=1 Tax=Mucilaginibacter limnophilus TaxID=1932778 RepID=A0A3S2X0W4_9SPHI|nr:HAMP domain-containing sensor histidine kinase [Mucilaginibacter limnophilus]RVU02858.1 HAMP domain-containing histidine kinase [Mucilaginibacter limnophilus]